MKVSELIRELKKLPQQIEVRYAVNIGSGKRTLCTINQVENYQNAWPILKFQDR